MTHRFDLRVYYEDTDMAGIVYYANYLRYLERGRSEAVRAIGVDQLRLRSEGQVFAVRRVEIDYLRPARFNDVLTVSTTTTRVGAATFEVRQDVHRDADHLIQADIKIAYMSLEGKVQRFPRDIRALLVSTLS